MKDRQKKIACISSLVLGVGLFCASAERGVHFDSQSFSKLERCEQVERALADLSLRTISLAEAINHSRNENLSSVYGNFLQNRANFYAEYENLSENPEVDLQRQQREISRSRASFSYFIGLLSVVPFLLGLYNYP